MPSPTGSTLPSQREPVVSSTFSSRAAASEASRHCVLGVLGQRHLAGHQEVVHHEHGALAELRVGQLDVALVLALRGVHEEKVEGAVQRRERLEGVALDELHAIGHPGALQEVARPSGALGVALERDHAALAQLLRHVERRVADGGADLQHHRVERAAERREEAAGLPMHDRDPVAVGQLLHLGHRPGALRAQAVEVALHLLVEDPHRRGG